MYVYCAIDFSLYHSVCSSPSILSNPIDPIDEEDETTSKSDAPTPTPQYHSLETGISACLLVNDENPRLREWIAYHYYMLPLRSLIIAIDPSSRSVPSEIIQRWKDHMNLDVQLWTEEEFMPHGGDGACNPADPEQDCLMQHRKRQQYFVRACMKDFKDRDKGWVLLTDVDEYITFNKIDNTQETIVNPPLDEAPDGIPILANWTWSRKGYMVGKQRITGTFVQGTVYGLTDKGIHTKTTIQATGRVTFQEEQVYNGMIIRTAPLINSNDEIFYGAYGSIFTDDYGTKWYLRDDYVYRDGLDTTEEDVTDHSFPIIEQSYTKTFDNGTTILYGIVAGNESFWNDDYVGKNDDDKEEKEESPQQKELESLLSKILGKKKKTKEKEVAKEVKRYKAGDVVEIQTSWKEPPPGSIPIKTLNGGHLIKDIDRYIYYVKRDTFLTPPHLTVDQLMGIRNRLPSVGDDVTLLDVLNQEMTRFNAELGEDYVYETLGPCLSLPRLLYGSQETKAENMAPQGFNEKDFVTLRYRWHSLPDNRVNKYQKNIIDVSRVPYFKFMGEAENIHTPIHQLCRKGQPPRYTTSFFRVNHYLDSYESYSYRNDAREDKKNCLRCYNDKGNEAHKFDDDVIRPWLKGFVKSVGIDKAKILLNGTGSFEKLPEPKLVPRDDDRDDDDYEKMQKRKARAHRDSGI